MVTTSTLFPTDETRPARPDRALRAVGVDACKAGWFAVRLAPGAGPEALTFPDISTLWAGWGRASSLVLIDVPIGLTDAETCRLCDAEARRLLGFPRASSVFNPPIRAALAASGWGEAADLNAAATGKRISVQGWAIAPKIREVDAFLTQYPARQAVVREVHPEVLFWALNGARPLTHAKKKAPGIEERLAILDGHLPGASYFARRAFESYPRGQVQRDDVVDALAAAVVGYRYGQELQTLPADPLRDARGIRMEMVIPPVATLGA